MDYNWRIILTNGKEYIVTNNIKEAKEMVNYVLGTTSNGITLSHHQLAESDLNKCKNVVINSAAVVSVEFNIFF